MKDYQTKIGIPKDKLAEYEKMFSYGMEEIVENKLPILANILTITAGFEDRCQVDVKINTSEDDVWSEAVLFDEDGNEIAHTEVCDSLAGKWSFVIDDDTYEVDVVGVE